MKTILLVLVSLLGAISFSRAEDTPKTFRAALEYCAGLNLASYDDGISPANVIGKALYGLCRQRNARLYDEIAMNCSRACLQGYEGAAIEQMTRIVLWYRAQKRR